MHVLGMIKHTRQILAKGATFPPLSPNMLEIPLMMTSENPWESSFQDIDTPTNKFYNVNSTTSHLARSSRNQNTQDCPLTPCDLNHLMTPMLNPHHNNQKRQWDGSIYLSRFIYVLMNEELKEAIKKHNLEALQKFQIGKYKFQLGKYKRLYVVFITPLLLQMQNQKINPLR